MLTTVARNQLANAIGLLRTELAPVIDAHEIEPQAPVFAASDRIEEADALEARSALAFAAIGDDDVIERLVLGTAARESNCDHNDVPCRPIAGSAKKSADSTQIGAAKKERRERRAGEPDGGWLNASEA